MQLLTELTTDFSRGELDDIAATRYPDNAVAEIQNGRIEPDGTVSRRDGSIRTHTTALSAADDLVGYGALEFTKADGTRQVLTFVGTTVNVSEDGGLTNVDVTPVGLTAGYYTFASMRVGATVYLFAANGSYVWRWNGTAFDVTPNAPTGVKYLAVFNGRLYVGGHNGVVVQASKIADPTTWASPDGLTVQVIIHDGDQITGMYQVGPHLLVFDHHATSYIDGYGEQTIIVASGATGFSRSVGCLAFRTIQGVGENAICWLSKRGIEYYAAGTGIVLLSRGIQKFFLETLDQAEIEANPGLPSAAYDDQRQWYYLAVPTAGIRNDRIVVINLLQQGTGWRGAPSIDQQFTDEVPVSGITFAAAADAEGYLTAGADDDLTTDADGYARLVTAGTGDTTVEDDDGYLATSAPTDGVAASLFIASTEEGNRVLHSLGYDAFIRRHFDQDRDDVHLDGTGGTDVELTMVSRPYHLRRPRQRKRVRVIHLSAINDADATFTLALRVAGATAVEREVSVPSTTYNQPRRTRVMANAIGDFPQVELRTTDRVRVALLGVSAELMREP